MNNPWNLSPRRVEVMDTLIETGCNKVAARKLGMELVTFELHMRRIYKDMQIQPSNRVTVALAWDRWRRQEQPRSGGTAATT